MQPPKQAALILFTVLALSSFPALAQDGESSSAKPRTNEQHELKSESRTKEESRPSPERREHKRLSEESHEYDLSKHHPIAFIVLMIVVVIAGVIYLIGQIQFIIATFRTGLVWGLTNLFFPIVGLFYMVFHWNESKRPLSTILTGLGLFLLAFGIAVCIQIFIDHS